MPAEPSYVPSMTAPLMTAEDLLHANIPDKRTELVRGRLIVREPAGYRHGAVTVNLRLRSPGSAGPEGTHLGSRSSGSAAATRHLLPEQERSGTFRVHLVQ